MLFTKGNLMRREGFLFSKYKVVVPYSASTEGLSSLDSFGDGARVFDPPAALGTLVRFLQDLEPANVFRDTERPATG